MAVRITGPGRWVCCACSGSRRARRGTTRPAGGHGLCSSCYGAWKRGGRVVDCDGRPVIPVRFGQPGWRSPAWRDRHARILDRIELGRSPALICQQVSIHIRTYQRHLKALKEEGKI